MVNFINNITKWFYRFWVCVFAAVTAAFKSFCHLLYLIRCISALRIYLLNICLFLWLCGSAVGCRIASKQKKNQIQRLTVTHTYNDCRDSHTQFNFNACLTHTIFSRPLSAITLHLCTSGKQRWELNARACHSNERKHAKKNRNFARIQNFNENHSQKRQLAKLKSFFRHRLRKMRHTTLA